MRAKKSMSVPEPAAGVVGATGVQGISSKSVFAWGSERSRGEVWEQEAIELILAASVCVRFASFSARFSAVSAPILLFGISIPTQLAKRGKLDKS